MTETINREIREFVEEQLNWILDFLMTKHGMNARDAKQLIKEILVCSI